EPVVELEVRREVRTAERGAAEDLREPLVALAAARAGRDEQRDVRVVRAGELVADEEAGVGVLRADALVVADLPGDGVAPADDLTARVRREAAVRRVEARLEGRRVAGDTVRLRQTDLVLREQRH